MDSNKNIPFPSLQERLHSFSSHPLPAGHKMSSMKLAEAGFERRPPSSSCRSVSDEVYCRMCGITYSGWSRESPWAVHRIYSPNCPFLNTPPSKQVSQSSSTQNTVMESGNAHVKENKLNSKKCSLLDFRRQLCPEYDILSLKLKQVTELQLPFQPKRGNFFMLFESHRLLTFENPLSTEAAIYAKAGFVYDRNIGRAVCIFCNFEVEFTQREKIFLEIYHEKNCSTCPFVRELDVGNISREDEHFIREKGRNTLLDTHPSDLEEEMTFSVKHPEYVQLSSRVDTFKSWPVLLASEFPIELMAKCGFYYTSFMDSVRCFSCGIGLRNWSKGADPFAQHAKASPLCWHILQVKTQAYVDEALRLQLTVVVDFKKEQDDDASVEDTAAESAFLPMTPPSSPSSSPPSSPSSSLSSSPSSSSGQSSPRSLVSPHLDLDSIQAALACQYSIEQIADAVIRFFVLSNGSYPNEALLIGSLRAADVNHKVICHQQEEIIKKDSELSDTKTLLKAKDSVIEATKNELARTQHTLQWTNTELRTELEQRFVEQNRILHQNHEIINQKDEMLNQKDEMLNQKDEIINQNAETIQNKDIQLELQRREVEDLHRQLKAMKAALEKGGGDLTDNLVEVPNDNAMSDTVNEDEHPVANCKVCLTNTSQVTFYPCKHACCCDACASRLIGKSCPICREQTLTMEKVYII